MIDRTWWNCRNTIRACNDPSYPGWQTYGGKGVTCFWTRPKDMAAYVRTLPGYDDPQLDMRRIDRTKGYEPGNIFFERTDKLDEITPREYECWLLCEVEGLTRRAAAAKIGISYTTVNVHIKSIRKKMMRMIDGAHITPPRSPASGSEDGV